MGWTEEKGGREKVVGDGSCWDKVGGSGMSWRGGCGLVKVGGIAAGHEAEEVNEKNSSE